MTELRTLLAGISALILGSLASLSSRRQPSRSRSARSTATPGFPPSPIPYRNGWQMAVEEINAAGGVLGRKLEVVSHDDGGKPEEAVTRRQRALEQGHVVLLIGTFFSNIGLAVSTSPRRTRSSSWPPSR